MFALVLHSVFEYNEVEKMEIYHADPTVPFLSTQQILLTMFDFHSFLKTIVRLISF